jgi:hypothetical protein
MITGKALHLWGDELVHCPFKCGDDEIFVAYYASAETGCFDALGWPRPRRVLDLFAEFRRITNGRIPPFGSSLIGALLYFGLPSIGGEDKEAMRTLIMSGGPWSDAEREAIWASSKTTAYRLTWPCWTGWWATGMRSRPT